MARRTLTGILAAVAGIALATGIALAGSDLASQRIGLSAEPLTAGDELAPPPARTTTTPAARKPARKKRKTRTTTTTTPPVATTAPPVAPPATTDDHGSGIEPGDDSGGHGRNRGRGGDD